MSDVAIEVSEAPKRRIPAELYGIAETLMQRLEGPPARAEIEGIVKREYPGVHRDDYGMIVARCFSIHDAKASGAYRTIKHEPEGFSALPAIEPAPKVEPVEVAPARAKRSSGARKLTPQERKRLVGKTLEMIREQPDIRLVHAYRRALPLIAPTTITETSFRYTYFNKARRLYEREQSRPAIPLEPVVPSNNGHKEKPSNGAAARVVDVAPVVPNHIRSRIDLRGDQGEFIAEEQPDGSWTIRLVRAGLSRAWMLYYQKDATHLLFGSLQERAE